MSNESISTRQVFCIIVLFIFGSSLIMGVSIEAAQDTWIALLSVILLATPLVIIYARIIRLYPEKDFFEISELLLGKIAGKIIIVLMTWYAIHLCALVLRNFSEFLQIHAMTETPQFPIMVSIILVVFYMVKSGIETMGKWSVFILPIIIMVVIFTTVTSIKKMDFTNIMPVMEHDIGTIATGAFQILTFPFAETVLFLCLACAFKKKGNPYKTYISAILVGTLVLLIIFLRNTFLLGPAMINAVYFPSYSTVRIINIGEFFTRIEGSIAMNFILAGIMKMSVCLLAASKGTARLFGIKDYRQILLPVSLLILALSAILYKSTMEMFNFIKYYKFYAILYQIVIPLIIWIFAEIKTRLRKFNNIAF